jgi:hypothetical protein
MNTVSDKSVAEKLLEELTRVRDALMRLRDYSPMIRELWKQAAGSIQRLEPQVKKELQK